MQKHCISSYSYDLSVVIKCSKLINIVLEIVESDRLTRWGLTLSSCTVLPPANLHSKFLILTGTNLQVQPQPDLSREMDLAVNSNNLGHLPNPKLILTGRKI
jgi:hypothetical protein